MTNYRRHHDFINYVFLSFETELMSD